MLAKRRTPPGAPASGIGRLVEEVLGGVSGRPLPDAVVAALERLDAARAGGPHVPRRKR